MNNTRDKKNNREQRKVYTKLYTNNLHLLFDIAISLI